MHSHQVIRDVLQTTSAKQIAADMSLSLSLIYKWAEKPDPDATTASHNPLDRMDQLMKSTRDLRLIHWLCQRAGGFFIRNPKTHHTHPEYLIPATNGVVQEFADLLAVIASAASVFPATGGGSGVSRLRSRISVKSPDPTISAIPMPIGQSTLSPKTK